MATSQRVQVNLQYTLPDVDAETLLSVAEQMGDSHTSIARTLLGERLKLLREGWRLNDPSFFAITQALAAIPEQRREEIMIFLSDTFGEIIEKTLTLRVKGRSGHAIRSADGGID